MKRVLIAVFAVLGVHVLPAQAQFVPSGASAASRPAQPGKSGVSTRQTMVPTAGPSPSTLGQPTSPGTVPLSTMSKEACEAWFKQKKKEHEACAKS